VSAPKTTGLALSVVVRSGERGACMATVFGDGMTNPELEVLKEKLRVIQDHIVDAHKDMEKMRSYFKYQSEDTHQISESAIVNWANFEADSETIINILDDIDELMETNG